MKVKEARANIRELSRTARMTAANKESEWLLAQIERDLNPLRSHDEVPSSVMAQLNQVVLRMSK